MKEAAIQILALLLRNQYVVGFKPNTANDKWQQIKIEIKLPPGAPNDLEYPMLKYRAGYFNRAARD